MYFSLNLTNIIINFISKIIQYNTINLIKYIFILLFIFK